MEDNKKIIKPVITYSFITFIVWSLLIGFAMWWNIQVEKSITIDTVTNIARSSFNKDQAYRQWATSHGGVYVEPTEKTPPSPWMAHLSDRDIVTTQGRKLTLMNPAYMLREMMQDYSDLYGIKGRIVGIIYLNENNKADKWEADTIRAFEKGLKERMEFTNIEGEEYLRLMKPMIMNQKCQKCHGHLGFPNGSVRGGVSVSVPMKEYRANEYEAVKNIILTYSSVWLFGMAAIVLIALRTIALLKRREKDLEEIMISSEVFNNTLDAIFITDSKGKILRINRSFTNLTGYEEDDILGKTPRVLKSNHHDKEFYKNLWSSLLNKGFVQVEIWNRDKDGEVFVSIESITNIKDDNGDVKYYIATLHDITARKNAEERVVHMAHYDPLTDLPNRVLFHDRFLHAIDLAKNGNKKVALAFIDLDGFKKVNDTKGHPFGDKLLKEVAKRIVDCVDKYDTVARLGGDEFTIIFENFGRIENILPSCEKILSELTEEITIDGQSVFISASMGISVYPNDGEDTHDLLQHADTAMYKAKEEGKNRFSFYKHTMTQQAQERVELETNIQSAIKNGEFVPYYQPKISLDDGKVIGMEALVRWIDPKKGLIAPYKFIPIAEDMQIIDRIDINVLKQVCSDMSTWKDMGHDNIKVAVNLSGYDLGIKDLFTRIRKIVEHYNVDPKNIEFEITETYFVKFDKDSLETLDRLKEYGFTLSIDDFGTGYSSLGNLQKLPIDILKIDQSFVRTLDENSDNKKLVDTIINLAHSLSLKIIAEGVETKYQFDYLRSKECTYMQGYLEARPMSKEDFIEYLKKKS